MDTPWSPSQVGDMTKSNPHRPIACPSVAPVARQYNKPRATGREVHQLYLAIEGSPSVQSLALQPAHCGRPAKTQNAQSWHPRAVRIFRRTRKIRGLLLTLGNSGAPGGLLGCSGGASGGSLVIPGQRAICKFSLGVPHLKTRNDS